MAGPAINFLTCFWLFPQKEHFSRSLVSPMRAMLSSFCRPTTGADLHDNRSPLRGAGTSRGVSGFLERCEDLVDDSVLHCLVSREVLVALDVLRDGLDRLPCVGGEHLLHEGPDAKDLPSHPVPHGGDARLRH